MTIEEKERSREWKEQCALCYFYRWGVSIYKVWSYGHQLHEASNRGKKSQDTWNWSLKEDVLKLVAKDLQQINTICNDKTTFHRERLMW